MADEQDQKDESSGGSGYTVNDDGSVTFDGEPSEETRKAAQEEVEAAAKERDEAAEAAAKEAGEAAIAANQAAAGSTDSDDTTTRETAEGSMPREKGTV